MRKVLALVVAAVALATCSCVMTPEPAKPIKALLITGGGFHDYEAQTKTLTEGLAKRLNLDLTVAKEGTTREHKHSIYGSADWAKGYDVIIHNECFGTVAEKDFVERVAAPHHAGVPAVILHASVHSYRNAPTDSWREVVGQRSMKHDSRRDLLVKTVAADHPIMRGFPADWNDPQDELYVVEKTWPTVGPLAKAHSVESKQDHVVVWTNTLPKTRIFVTTLGHFDATMKTDAYLDLVARGLLWSIGKLNADGTPAKGYGPGGR
jgi:type 1 glutamine amidotransferase